MKNSKKEARLRRAKRKRCKQRELAVTRLVVHRTPRHIYAQVIKPGNLLEGSTDKVIAAASTLEKALKDKVVGNTAVEVAKQIGQVIAQRCSEKGIKKVAFDTSGFKYHGRVKALAEAAREAGLTI